MNKRKVLRRKKIVGRILLLFFSLLIGVLVLISIFQGSDDPEVRFQNELLENRYHKIDENCFYFDAFDKELVTLLKAFKRQNPELQINGIFRSGNGTFVIVSSKEQKN